MFKRDQNIEEDFMHYNSDTPSQPESIKGGGLHTLVQILLILVLLAILVLVTIFGYRYLQESKQPKTRSENFAHDAQTAPKSGASGQRLYTQEEMQKMVELAVAKMKEQSLQKSEPKSVVSSEEESVDNLLSSLEEMDVDQIEDLERGLQIDTDKGVKANQKGSGVDHYNKVVVKKNQNSYDDLARLSEEISSVVKGSNVTDKKGKGYAKSMQKELAVRSREMRFIVVKRGDTLSTIAKRAYGSSMAYDKILKANPDLIKNPNHIYIGQKLRVPLN